ncbi:MAG: nitrilase-related carbon-nitrogen hydrolase [Desulfitobacteriaceae bacterium]
MGHSMIVDPWGIPIASAGDYESIISADVDSKEVRQVREIFPPVKDRVIFD